jgi:hypothetical protein
MKDLEPGSEMEIGLNLDDVPFKFCFGRKTAKIEVCFLLPYDVGG